MGHIFLFKWRVTWKYIYSPCKMFLKKLTITERGLIFIKTECLLGKGYITFTQGIMKLGWVPLWIGFINIWMKGHSWDWNRNFKWLSTQRWPPMPDLQRYPWKLCLTRLTSMNECFYFFLFNFCESYEGTVVNRVLPSLHGGSLEVTTDSLVHLNFRAGSIFPVPVCTVSPGHWVNNAVTQ